MVRSLAAARAAALAWLVTLVPGVDAVEGQPCTLCVKEAPRLIVGADGVAADSVVLCNQGVDPVTLGLAISDFSAPDANAQSFPLGTTRTLSAELPVDRDIVEGRASLGKRCLSIKLQVSGVWQAGLSTATLRNGNEDLATVQAVRLHAPFKLRMEGPNPSKAELQLVDGKPFQLALVNDDEMGYRFRWRLEGPGQAASGVDYVRPKRSVPLQIPADAISSVSWLESGFLRSASQDWRLVVDYEPDSSLQVHPLPRNVYDIKATIGSFDPIRQRISNIFSIILLLIVGIVASLLINYALPIQRRRVANKQRLALLEGRLAGLGGHVPSRILSMLRVEKRRLGEALRQLWPIDPTTEIALPKLEAQIDWVDRRIALVTTAGEHLAALAGSARLAVPQDDQVRAACQSVFETVIKPQANDDDIKRAQAALVLVADLRASATLPPSAPMLQALGEAAVDVRKRLALGSNPSDHAAAFDELVRALLLDVPEATPTALTYPLYVDAALAVAKAEVVADYKHLLAGAERREVADRRTDRAVELLAALCPGPDESLACARQIVLEAEQAVSEKDLEKALQEASAGDLWIDVDPPKPLPYQSVKLRVRLRQAGLDDAVARCRIECAWEITGRQIEGDDWEVNHYFDQPWAPSWHKKWWARLTRQAPPKAPEPIQVSASLRLRDKEPVNVKSVTVAVEPPKSYFWASAWLSLGATFVTMLIVGIGLIAGAQEKIQSLDWVSGVFAVLALGFGADVLKRVVTRP